MATSIILMRRRRQKIHKTRLFKVSSGGDNMKSELICQPRVKLAKLSSPLKRNMSSKEANLENGESEKITSCVSENLKSSKLTEFSKLSMKQLEKPPDGILNDNKPNCEEPKLSKEESQDTRHLKELLLLHLDLIQQQQDLLLMKDRQLQQVTHEKETLRCRLERMERRMQLLRQTRDSSGGRHSLAEAAGDLSPVSDTPETNHNSSSSRARGTKRKNNLEPQSLVKKFATIARNEYHRSRQSSQSATTPSSLHHSRTRGPRGDHHTPSSSSRHHRHRHDSQSENDDSSSQSSKNSSSSASSSSSSSAASNHSSQAHSNKSGGKDDGKNKTKITLRTPRQRSTKSQRQRKRIPNDDKILRTDTMYYVPNEEIVPMDISPRKPEKEDEVAVPSFRIKVVPRGYTMEGTENLGDEIYLKRHQKPENDEKRRKRWDMQRLREQKAMERLHQSRSYRNDNGQDEDDDFETFLPDPDKVEYIEVCDKIPVSAFGFPLPKLDKNEFSLPWFDMERHEQTEKQKSRSRKR